MPGGHWSPHWSPLSTTRRSKWGDENSSDGLGWMDSDGFPWPWLQLTASRCRACLCCFVGGWVMGVCCRLTGTPRRLKRCEEAHTSARAHTHTHTLTRGPKGAASTCNGCRAAAGRRSAPRLHPPHLYHNSLTCCLPTLHCRACLLLLPALFLLPLFLLPAFLHLVANSITAAKTCAFIP
jgi:hypothetical protein